MIALLVAAALAGTPGGVTASAPKNDNGLHLHVEWENPSPDGTSTVILRHDAGATAAPPAVTGKPKPGDDAGDGWTVAYFGDSDTSTDDEVPDEGSYVYAGYFLDHDGHAGAPTALSPAAHTKASWFNTDNWFYLLLVAGTGVLFALYLPYAKKHARKLFIRRIAGVDAIEDAIGRSTEMGRPILYVTGVEEITDIQTIASLLILGHVSEVVAAYDTDMKVANCYPMTMIVAEEIVRQGYANAGRLDAHRPENVMFITSEQFAFAAAVNGIILRDRPATNIYFGRFYAESLLLSETGFLTGAVQIAGTAEFTQLPFFIAACDYTLLGEELYATSAYLAREPTLVTQLKVGDIVKAFIMITIVVGMVLATVYGWNLGNWLMPGGS
jgi:hypothetical protein